MELELQNLQLTPCECYVPCSIIGDYENDWAECGFAEAFIDWSNAVFHNHIYGFEDDVLADFAQRALDYTAHISLMRVNEICAEIQEKAKAEWKKFFAHKSQIGGVK